MKPSFLSVAVAALLVACGGGSGGGGGGTGFPPTPAPAPAPSPAPAAPEPSPAPPVVDDLKTCITSPQSGSIAEIGHAHEGLWIQKGTIASQQITVGWMSVAPDGAMDGYQRLEPDGPSIASLGFRGAASFGVADGTWRMPAGTTTTGTPERPFETGLPLRIDGTFTARSSIQGTYSVDGAARHSFGPWDYDQLSNSLALTSSMLVHTWTGPGYGSFTVAADGAVSGSTPRLNPLGACAISGSVALMEPGTKKNRLIYDLTFSNAADTPEDACKLSGAIQAQGHVEVLQRVTDGVCKRKSNLTLLMQDLKGNMRRSYAFPYNWS